MRRLIPAMATFAAVAAFVLIATPAYADGGYSAAVVADGPVSYWRLGETSGSVAADALGSNPGSYKPGTTLGESGALPAESNPSVGLNGSTGYVSVPNASTLNITDNLSVEAWARPAALSGVTQAVVHKGGSTGNSVWQYRIALSSSNKWRGTVYIGSTAVTVTDPGTPSTTSWSHLALTASAGLLTLYVNGQSVATTSYTGAVNTSTGVLAIGRTGGASSDYFQGRVDEVAVYPLALTAAQVANHYAVGSTPPTAPPVADFTLAPTTGDAPLTVAFTDRSTGGAPTSWSWDFGDGSGSTTLNPTHTYTTPGTYTVSLIAANAVGSSTASQAYAVTVTTPPVTDPVLVGAGDIADCSSTGDEATAALVAGIPGTVFTVGDNVYDNGTASEFANCYDPSWGQFKSRTRPAAGNHDYNTPGAAGYYGYFGAAAGDPTKGYYSYDIGAWHVIVLNAECDHIGGCGPGSQEEQWLRADLAAHPTMCTAAIWHEPRYSSGATHGDDVLTATFWEDLYYAGAELVINGHDHDYERFAPMNPRGEADPAHGLREIVVGTGGKSLTNFGSTVQPNSVVRNAANYGVLKLTLHDTSYDWQFIPVPGGTGFTDAGTAACVADPPAPPPTPTADFTASPTAGDAPLTVTFSDRSEGEPSGWAWDFGDGATSTLQNPVHTYAAAGVYSVRLTVRNYTGSASVTKSDLVTVTVPAPPDSYNTTVLADGPTGYWRLGEASGTSAADETGAPAGTINPGVTLGRPGALFDDPNTAIALNGSTGYVSVANRANLNPTADFTVEAWVRPTALNGVGGAILHKGGSSGNSVWQYRLSLSSSGKWRGTIFSGSTAYTVTDPGTPSTTAWTYLAMTRSGSQLTLYVNGLPVATTTVTATINTSTGLFAIGRTGSANADYFAGSIDEVAFYPTALSSSRIFAHYTAGTS